MSTISVNRQGPPSMPRAELGIHGLKARAATGLEKSEKRGVQAARNGPSPPPTPAGGPVAKAEMSTADRLRSRDLRGARAVGRCVIADSTHPTRCRMAISSNACALPDFPAFAQSVRYGVPGTHRGITISGLSACHSRRESRSSTRRLCPHQRHKSRGTECSPRQTNSRRDGVPGGCPVRDVSGGRDGRDLQGTSGTRLQRCAYRGGQRFEQSVILGGPDVTRPHSPRTSGSALCGAHQ